MKNKKIERIFAMVMTVVLVLGAVPDEFRYLSDVLIMKSKAAGNVVISQISDDMVIASKISDKRNVVY